MATSSGQRHVPEPVVDIEMDSDSSDSDLEEIRETKDTKPLFSWERIVQENTVKLWWLGDDC